ncbi:MAG: DUF1553 domain-containing protein, partial [Acidobacteriota bacterium]|nr:DUF1553 domain-containing protein [Acidobacteriota bacterium]
GPMQRLYFMNNSFVGLQAKALADRLAAKDAGGDGARIAHAYRLLFGRAPTNSETQMGLDFLAGNGRAWAQYTQVLLSSAEFSSVN